MKLVVNNARLSSVQEYDLVKGKTIELDGVKAERKDPVRKWFRVVGYKLVMYRATIIAITPRIINSEGISFTVKGDASIIPSGEFMMVKNAKDGDVYFLKEGQTMTFKTSGLGGNNEYIVSIKEEK